MTRWHCTHLNDAICKSCAPYLTAAYSTPTQPVASSPAVAIGGAL
jgi:hypothetical protein